MFLYVTVSTLNPIVGMVEMTSPTCKRYRIVVLPAHGLVHLQRCMRVALRGNEAAWSSTLSPCRCQCATCCCDSAMRS